MKSTILSVLFFVFSIISFLVGMYGSIFFGLDYFPMWVQGTLLFIVGLLTEPEEVKQ